MAGEKVYTSKDGALWIQPDGPATKPQYLGCYDLDDLSGDQGDITLIQCFDVNGQYQTRGFTQDAPSPITTTLTTWLGKTSEFLEDLKCPFLLHVNLRCSGHADVFGNYDRAVVLQVAKITNRTLSGLVMRSEDNQAEQSFDISILPPFIDVFNLTPLRQGSGSDDAITDLYMLDFERCATDCSTAIGLGDLGIFVTSHPGSSVGIFAVVYLTDDGGETWTAAGADPFAGGTDIGTGVGFFIGRDTIRWLVGRGTADGGPADVAYSDDDGATWTLAAVGSTNGQYFVDSKTLYVADQFNIWAVTSGGYIYKSEDGGITWTTQEAGSLTVQNLHRVQFQKGSILVGWACGASNVILRTIDGGTTWSLVTGPGAEAGNDAVSLAVLDRNHAWVGYDSGNLWYTDDGGETWTQFHFSGDGVGIVQDVAFVNAVIGYMVHDNASPVGTVFFTRDGGYTWEALTTPTNAGLNVVSPLSSHLAFVGGEVSGGTGMILKVS